MNRNSRLLIVLAIAVVCATASSYVVYRALAQRPTAEAGPQLVGDAGRRPAHSRRRAGDAKTCCEACRGRPTAACPAASPTPKQVLDRGAIASIAENEPITESKLAAVGAGAGLPPTIPPGMRGDLGARQRGHRRRRLRRARHARRRGRHLRVARGSRAKALARVVVSNVQVLTAGTRYDQEKARQDARPIPTSVVTLLVSPEDAERIALAAAEGRITLTLRNPLDTAPTETTGIRMAGLMGDAGAAAAGAGAAAGAAAASSRPCRRRRRRRRPSRTPSRRFAAPSGRRNRCARTGRRRRSNNAAAILVMALACGLAMFTAVRAVPAQAAGQRRGVRSQPPPRPSRRRRRRRRRPRRSRRPLPGRRASIAIACCCSPPAGRWC